MDWANQRPFMQSLIGRLNARDTMDQKAIPIKIQSKLSEIIEQFISERLSQTGSCPEAKRAKHDEVTMKMENKLNTLENGLYQRSCIPN